MSPNFKFILSVLVSAGLVAADSAGYFDDTSICADSKGLSKCYDQAEASWSSCVNNNCAGGGADCYDSCNGDRTCMESQCPNLGINCMNACSCVHAVDQIDCLASNCWNQVQISYFPFRYVLRHMFNDSRSIHANTNKQWKTSSIYAQIRILINFRSGLPPMMPSPDASAT